MRKIVILIALLLCGCAASKNHFLSSDFREKIREPFALAVASDPKFMEGDLYSLAQDKLAEVASLIDAQSSGKISISFKTRQALTTDKDGKQPFDTRPEVQPRSKHIYQSAEMEIIIEDNAKSVIYRNLIRYEGRNDYKANYVQKPEEAMEECLNRVIEALKKDMKK